MKPERSVLNVATYNMQSGVTTDRYLHYLTRGWHSFAPHRRQSLALRRGGDALADFDLVALQEIDGGSWRSQQINQLSAMAKIAGFKSQHFLINRNMGRWAKHGLGLLSHFPLRHLEDIKLPGLLPGRGAMHMQITLDQQPIDIVVTHLSLGRRSRQLQLAALAARLVDVPRFVLLGDMNCSAAELRWAFRSSRKPLLIPTARLASFPSWQPRRALDHVVVAGMEVRQCWALPPLASDHLPVAVSLTLKSPH